MIEFIRNSLFDMQDTAYRDFHSRLVPTLEKESIIGVRTPHLRKFTKELMRSVCIDEFLCDLPHKYYEENNVHGFIIQYSESFDRCIELLDKFLPYIDNWATCDMLRPGCFKNNTGLLYPYVLKWLNDDKVYTVRFAIGCLNSYYLDECFRKEHLQLVTDIMSDEYYVNMMRAWYFATALTKQYDDTLPFIEKRVLDRWTHNKAIQKAVESYRIHPQIKEYLRTLKI